MNIEQILKNMQLTESAAANRPLDQNNGDQTPTAVADPAGGAAGYGKPAPATRPADNVGNGDPAPAAVAIQNVDPNAVIPDPQDEIKESKGSRYVVTAPHQIGSDKNKDARAHVDRINSQLKSEGKEGDHAYAKSLVAAVPDADKLGLVVTERKGLTEDVSDIAESFTSALSEQTSEVSFDITEATKEVIAPLGLDEEYTAKVIGIFESTIKESTAKHIAEINQVAGQIFEAVLAKKLELLEGKNDKFMANAISEWVETNKISIQNGMRTQIAESFMEKLKGLLESHYVELPENKKDLYEAAIQKGDEILESYNSEKEKTVSLSEEVASLRKELAIANAVQGMVATKAEKVRSLAESIEFNDDFAKKIESIKEEVSKVPAKVEAPVDASVIVESLQEDRREKKASVINESVLRFLDRQKF